ncbi:MAG TPA: hypothetical protein VIY29_08930, partial [Ktedonobacteraceae bacterium]
SEPLRLKLIPYNCYTGDISDISDKCDKLVESSLQESRLAHCGRPGPNASKRSLITSTIQKMEQFPPYITP